MDPTDANEDAAIAFVLALGKALHRYGTPAHRLEEGLLVCCRQLGLADAEVFTTPTTIIMSFGDPHELRTRMMRVESGELDMSKLAAVDHLADLVGARTIPISDGLARLEAIVRAPPRYGRVLSTFTHAVTVGAFAVFFGGSIMDVAVAAAIGLAVGLLAAFTKRSVDRARMFELVGSMIASTAAGVASSIWTDISPSLVTIAALIVLLPGLSLTVAMTELTTRHIMAGTSRLVFAVIVLLELVVGVAIGSRLASVLVDVHHAAPIALPAYAQWIALGAAALGVGVVVQASPRAFGWILAASLVGYLGANLGDVWLGRDMGVLVGAFALGVTSNAYARWLHRPAQVVQVPAVLLLVPGSMGFRGISSLLGRDTLTGIETVFAMFIVAVAIAGGLLVANATLTPRRSL
ncbi:MAG: threonine/serine exporter ThrE family protein [Kofleriaceae bacterium]